MTKTTGFLTGHFLILLFCVTPSVSAPLPSRADIAKIYNITPAADQTVDVRFFRKGECSQEEWCRINRTGEYLKASDWLQTGNVSRADLALMYNTVDYRPVLFWQEEGSKSRFEPKEGDCHFRIELGKFLYAHPHQSGDKGCRKITSKHALIFPYGTALFVIQGASDTFVGVLSSPTAPVVVQNSHSGKKARLRAGQFAKSFGDGSMQQGEFSLTHFYKTQTLGRGLGPESDDTDYVARQEPGIRAILEEIREESLTALREQDASKQTAEKTIPWDKVEFPAGPEGDRLVGGTGPSGGTDGGGSTGGGTSDGSIGSAAGSAVGGTSDGSIGSSAGSAVGGTSDGSNRWRNR